MSLLDDIEALTNTAAPCRYARLADELTAEEWEKVDRLARSVADGTAPGRTGYKTLADKLSQNGHRIIGQTIKKHIEQGCTCGASR